MNFFFIFASQVGQQLTFKQGHTIITFFEDYLRKEFIPDEYEAERQRLYNITQSIDDKNRYVVSVRSWQLLQNQQVQCRKRKHGALEFNQVFINPICEVFQPMDELQFKHYIR